MGHVAIANQETAPDARLRQHRVRRPAPSDYIDETISGLKFKIRFLRVNERHHSVADRRGESAAHQPHSDQDPAPATSRSPSSTT